MPAASLLSALELRALHPGERVGCAQGSGAYTTHLALKAGDLALVRSAAGGAGSLLVPWLRDKGVVVVAHAGSPEKFQDIGAEHKLSFTSTSYPKHCWRPQEVARWTWSMTCRNSFLAGLTGLPETTRTDGQFWQCAGSSIADRLGRVDADRLADGVRPTLADYIASREDLARTAKRLVDRITENIVRPTIGQRFALGDVADAHEARRTAGSTILIA